MRPPMAGWPTSEGCADCNTAVRICYHDGPAGSGDFRPSDAKYDDA